MTNSEKELAFLQDLYLSIDWTEKFTNLFDEKFKFSRPKKVLYVNAGTGTHALILREKLNDKVEFTPVCENIHLQKIAQAKADTMMTKIKFETNLPTAKFDTVITDASLVDFTDLTQLIEKLANYSTKHFVFFLPTSGSFGEIFSFLWEAFFNLDLTEKSVEIERLISELPSVSVIEDLAVNAGLKEVESVINTEIFEFANGKEFIESPLIANFLLPKWLSFLSEKERKQVAKNLVKVIDNDDQDLSFRFTVKATLIKGEKS